MDPVTTAIIAAVATGAAGAAKEVSGQVIVDAYNGLKTVIKRKFGADSKVVEAIQNYEDEPDFDPNKSALEGRVKQANLNDDEEVQKAAEKLLAELKALPGGEKNIQTAIGSYIAQADRGSTATVSVNQPEEKDD